MDQKTHFSLWLEFELEHWHSPENPPYDPEDEFFTMTVTLASGKKYALNVWTFKFFDTAVRAIRYQDPICEAKVKPFALAATRPLEREYLVPPDLLVSRLDRKLIEDIITHMLAEWRGQLLPEWECDPPLEEEE